MSEETTAETVEATQEVAATVEAKPAEDPRVSKANKEAAEYRKQLRAAQAELEKLKAASMSEAERLAAEAKQAGRAEAITQLGQRLVRAEFKAAAGGRLTDEQLDDLNLAKFLGEDGEPDTAAIAKAVARLALAPAEDTSKRPGPRPDLSQGSKSTTALNSDALTEALKRAVGAR